MIGEPEPSDEHCYKYEETIKELELLLSKYPDNSIINFRLGYAYKETKDYDNLFLSLQIIQQFNLMKDCFTLREHTKQDGFGS